MYVKVPVGQEELGIRIDVPSERVVVARSKDTKAARDMVGLAREALANPIQASRIRDTPLRNKRVAVMTDDRERPTPARRVVPLVLEELEEAGVAQEDVVFVLGTGLHSPPDTRVEQVEKLGEEVVSNYRVVVHSAYDRDHLTFMGISDLGTPIWINSYVAEADYRLSIGRIGPHGSMGYEGGAKMIVPGVSSLETVMHNHRMLLSPQADVGTLEENPARRDADNIGGIVDLHFILNFVYQPFWGRITPLEPVKAFAGHYIAAHRAGVEWGERNVWGAEIGEKADITVASPGSRGDASVSIAAMNAAAGTKKGGTIVLIAPDEKPTHKLRGEGPSPELAALLSRLRDLSLEESLRINARCEWAQPEDWLHMMRNAAGKARQYRNNHHYIHTHGRISDATLRRMDWEHMDSPEEAVEKALSRHGDNARVLVLPAATSTLPLERFHSATA